LIRARVFAFAGGLATTSVACAGILGIEDITNDPPSTVGPETSTTPESSVDTDTGGGNDGASTDAPVDSNDAGADTGPPPSCVGLGATCGNNSNDNCCSTILVPGGVFNRSNDTNAPATVPDFRLDKYEVTVARFRTFVAAYQQNMIGSGAGAHPGIANSGWQTAFNAQLPASATALKTALNCNAPVPALDTWTENAGANDKKPINCVTWYEALAFCIWDGGYLATEAEWNYAAAAGSEQRLYPWNVSTPAPSAANTVCGQVPIANVGSKSTAGDSKLGHVDLLGNVSEWALDLFAPYPSSTPCNNCAQLTTGTERIRRGGDFTDTCADQANVSTTGRRNEPATDRRADVGIRCARAK
jgi:formylglycine-generating enzyme